MTRINCIPPSELTPKHLLAEYRELPRVFGYVKQAVRRKEKPSDPRFPNTYRLGKGHVLFFYPRLGYLAKRQLEIIEECKRRGYNPRFTEVIDLIDGIPNCWFGDWEPSESAMAANRQRIQERINASSKS